MTETLNSNELKINNIFSWELEVYDKISDNNLTFNGSNFLNSNFILDESDCDELLEEWALSPENNDNIYFTEIIEQYYGNIIDFKVKKVTQIDKYPKRISLPFKTDYFGPNKWEKDKVLKWYEKHFNLKYPTLTFLDFFSEDSNVSFERLNKEQGRLLSFDLTSELLEKIKIENPILLIKNFEKEESECIIKINNNDVDDRKVIEQQFETFKGNFAVLEGDFHLDEQYNPFIDKLNRSNRNYITITDLYNYPSKLKLLKKYNIENLLLTTTGFNADGLKKLISAFIELKFIPKNLFIIGENKLPSSLFEMEQFKNVNVLKALL